MLKTVLDHVSGDQFGTSSDHFMQKISRYCPFDVMGILWLDKNDV
jgi:hypothetical protein